MIEARSRPFFDYQWVLPLRAGGEALVRIPDRPPELPREMVLVEYDTRSGFDAPGRVVQTIVERGPAALQNYMRFSTVSAGQLKAVIAGQLAGSPQWDSIEDVRFRFDTETQASILTIEGSGPIDWEAGDDGGYSLTLPGGGFSPPARRQRGDSHSDVPFWQPSGFSCHATTVRLPEGTDLDHWGFNATCETMLFGRVYYRMMEERADMTLRMVRGSRTEVHGPRFWKLPPTAPHGITAA
ncbi:MAG: hypothetical protein V2J51_05740 [Erythrobacter sp.]|nr:hypothetical protein [Erythrobacter sp.]